VLLVVVCVVFFVIFWGVVAFWLSLCFFGVVGCRFGGVGVCVCGFLCGGFGGLRHGLCVLWVGLGLGWIVGVVVCGACGWRKECGQELECAGLWCVGGLWCGWLS